MANPGCGQHFPSCAENKVGPGPPNLLNFWLVFADGIFKVTQIYFFNEISDANGYFAFPVIGRGVCTRWRRWSAGPEVRDRREGAKSFRDLLDH